MIKPIWQISCEGDDCPASFIMDGPNLPTDEEIETAFMSDPLDNWKWDRERRIALCGWCGSSQCST